MPCLISRGYAFATSILKMGRPKYQKSKDSWLLGYQNLTQCCRHKKRWAILSGSRQTKEMSRISGEASNQDIKMACSRVGHHKIQWFLRSHFLVESAMDGYGWIYRGIVENADDPATTLTWNAENETIGGVGWHSINNVCWIIMNYLGEKKHEEASKWGSEQASFNRFISQRSESDPAGWWNRKRSLPLADSPSQLGITCSGSGW